jgi:hypothetical protein
VTSEDSWFESRQEKEMYLFSTKSRPGFGPTRSPVQWAPEGLCPVVKRLEREAQDLHPTSAEFKNERNCICTQLHGMQRPRFTFNLRYGCDT